MNESEFFAEWDNLSQDQKAVEIDNLAPEYKQLVLQRARQRLGATPENRQRIADRVELLQNMPSRNMDETDMWRAAVTAGLEDFAVGGGQLAGAVLDPVLGTDIKGSMLRKEDQLRKERQGVLTGYPDYAIPSPTEAYDVGGVPMLDVARGGTSALAGLLTGRAGAGLLGKAGQVLGADKLVRAGQGFREAYPIASSIARGGAAVGGGAAAGAAGGAAIPLSSEEEALGRRGENAKTGAVVGAAAPVALGGINTARNAVQLLSRQTPDEATRELADRLGYRVGDDLLEPQLDFRRNVEGAFQDARKRASAMYDVAENREGLPEVRIPTTSRLDLRQSLEALDANLGLSSSPKIRRVFEALSDPRNASATFAEMRELQRQVRSVTRSLPQDSPLRAEAKRAEAVLEDAFQQWEKTDFNTRGALISAQRADEYYADMVKPFEEGRLGDIRGNAPRYEVDNALAQRDSGYSYYSPDAENLLTSPRGLPLTKEVIARVPEAAEPLRKVWARNVLNAGRTPASRAEMLSGGGPLRTLGVNDKDVLTQAERIAQSYRGQDESPVMAMLARKIPLAERLMSGVPRIGQSDNLSDMDIPNALLASWLMGGPVQGGYDRDNMQ